MNNPILIAFDGEDSELGHFFHSCADAIRQAVVNAGLDYELIGTHNLTKDEINARTKDADEYIFCAFSHGNDSALVCNGKLYVEANVNVCNFYNSIFYTFSCNTAKIIGQEFKDAYVAGYFGYNDVVSVVLGYEDMFVKCAVSGLLSYILGKTLAQARQDMIEEYDRQIVNGEVNLVYASLLKNKQALVTIINEENKTISSM